MNMKQAQQSGFTLIELVMVIVILGILAATALPRFVDLSDQAELAATQGVAGAVSSGYAVNYAAALAGNPTAVAVTGTVTVQTSAGQVMTGGVPGGYVVRAADDSATVTCTARGQAIAIEVSNGQGSVVPATLICTG